MTKEGDDRCYSSINDNTVKLQLRTIWSFSFTIIITYPNDQDITGQYIISPENVDWMLRGLRGTDTSQIRLAILLQPNTRLPTQDAVLHERSFFLSSVAGYPILHI